MTFLTDRVTDSIYLSPSTAGEVARLINVLPKWFYCIEAHERSKIFPLIIRSSLFEGIFIDAKEFI